MDKVSLTKVISGGQTGADMAGLRAAKRTGFETGGTAPPGFQTSAGKQRDVLQSYNLVAVSTVGNIAAGYIKRSQMNVDAADATVVFRTKASAGTDKTIGYCIIGKWTNASAPPVGTSFWEPASVHKPVLVIIEMNKKSKTSLLSFLADHRVETLNVAGHKDDGPGGEWQTAVETFLVDAFESI
jgi:hypothetical protein